MTLSQLSRRTLLQGAAASTIALPLLSLQIRRASALVRLESIPSPYGAVAPVRDRTTGLALLQVPEGFSYQSFGWAGDPMDTGEPTPMAHDGMAVVRARLVGGQPEITLIRNHESDVAEQVGLINAAAVYDGADITYDDRKGKLSGGTTKLVMRGDRWISATPALGGTLNNCAGGPTPWNTWLTCEEDKTDLTDAGGRAHGYVFEVSDDPTKTSGKPIVAMGRFDHEAVAVDSSNGTVYLTEDDRNQSGFYKYVPSNGAAAAGELEQGGRLYMAKVAGTDGADLLAPKIGESHKLEWIEIAEPDLAPQPFSEAPFTDGNRASGPFVQGRQKGALRMSRLEGIFLSAGERKFYIVDTSSGMGTDEDTGTVGAGFGEGSVWRFDAATDTLTCVFQSDNPLARNNFDNLTVSPRGGVLLCEDRGGVDDAFGPGERLMGLTLTGETYIFAKNNVTLTVAEIQGAGKSLSFIEEGDYRATEWAGVSFDPSGRTLFVNLQSPGITFAITGPWERGFL